MESHGATSTKMIYSIKRRHSGVSLVDLPRELRDMIYQHIPENTGYDIHVRRRKPHWKLGPIGDVQDGRSYEEKQGNSGVAFGSNKQHNAILLTCRAIHSEALPILYAATPLGLWRPMYDYGGRERYCKFADKVFTSLPVHATKHIRTLQLQGELFQTSMHILLSALPTSLPALRVLDIVLDPYYDNATRRNWLNDRAFARQTWPALAALSSIVQHLKEINITLAPPKDVIYIHQDNTQGVWLSGKRYEEFIWSYLQVSVLKYELTIYGGIGNGHSKVGMEFFMDRLDERRDLFEICQRGQEAEEYLDKLAKFKIEDEQEYIQKTTGRVLEKIDDKARRIVMVSAPSADKKWCRVTYTAAPRGFADPEGLLSS